MSSPSIVRPRHLQPGDTVAVVTPSWGGPERFPHIYERGLDVLRGWGLEIREYATTRAPARELWHDPVARARDLTAAFADPSIAGIFTSIGGDDSIRILPYLDFTTMAANPKILMGFSDASTLLVTLRRLGIVSFHGPSLMAGLSQVAALPQAFGAHVREMLFEPAASHTYVQYGVVVEGYPDWRDPANAGLVNPPVPDDGWHAIQGSGRVSGELFGGCLEVLDWMRGMPAWPSGEDWDGRLLMIEPSEEKPSPEMVARIMRTFGVAGVFDRVSGVLVGRARDHDEEEKRALEAALAEVVAEEFGRPDLPIVANLDFGHTDPQWVLPIGIRAELDVDARTLRLIEPWLD